MDRLFASLPLLASFVVTGCAQPGHGSVWFGRNRYAAADLETEWVTASFGRSTTLGDVGDCLHTRMGHCESVVCRSRWSPRAPATMPAGDVAALVDGVPFGLELFVDDGGNASYSADVTGLHAGARLAVSATGDRAPAFYAEGVFPSAPELRLPARTEPGSPLRIEWAPPPDDPDLWISVGAPEPGWRFFEPPAPYVVCTPPASDGSVTIPIELLAILDAGHEPRPLAVSAAHTLATTTRIDDFVVDVVGSELLQSMRIER